MRVNIYAEEIGAPVEMIEKTSDDGTFTGLRFWLHLPVTLEGGVQAKGPFMHRPGDDDSSAVTFWGKRAMIDQLRQGLGLLLDRYPDERAKIAAEVEQAILTAHGEGVDSWRSNAAEAAIAAAFNLVGGD